MFANLFSSDKAPFILTLTLAILSWFISNIVSSISEVTVVSIATTVRGQNVIYEIVNYSLKASVTDAYFRFNCLAKNCLQPLSEMQGTKIYANAQHVPPYEIQGDPFCKNNDSSSVSVRLSLPPGAAIRFELRPAKRNEVNVIFAGLLSGNCPDSETHLAPANMWIYTGCSITLLLIRYYFQILVGLLLLTLGFLGYLLFRGTPAPVATEATRDVTFKK
jgi:hypothetical protein